MTEDTDKRTAAMQEIAPKPPVAMTRQGLELATMEDAWRFASGIIKGRMAPKGVTEPGAVVALIQAGYELGLPPMQALSNLTFINGRLGIMGDAARALIHQKKVCAKGGEIRTEIHQEGTDEMYALVRSRRVGEADFVDTTFSVKDAKRAKLWGKTGPWSEYPKRMLTYRALGFHVRDQYPDVLLGATLTEELHDHPGVNVKGRQEYDVTPPKGPDPLLEMAASTTAQGGPEPEEAPPDETGDVPSREPGEAGGSSDAGTTEERVEPEVVDDEPPPHGDADAPELPLEEPADGPCAHLAHDGGSAWVRIGDDYEICMKCNEQRSL